MADSYVIYCDEAGNDGPNYLNPDAPFYVLAGWIIPESRLVDITVVIEGLRQRHAKDSSELKFSNFKRRPWVICEAMARLGHLDAVPIYVVAEKRYCIAGKIVETLLDPYYNKRLQLPFTYDFNTKRELANTLYSRLPDEVLAPFAEAYRNPQERGFEDVLTLVADACEEHVNPELAHLLEGSRDNLKEIADSETTAVESWGKVLGTLNFPCLISFLMHVEELGRRRSYNVKRIVHDEQGPYQSGYLAAFDHHRGMAKDDKLQAFGMRVPYGAIKMVEEFEFQSSEKQPLVQAADLLAGGIAHLSKKLVAGQDLHPQETEMARLVLPPLVTPGMLLAFPVCSEKMMGHFGEAIREAFPKEVEDHAADRNSRSLQWRSTVPAGDTLAVLPPNQGGDGDDIEVPHYSLKVDLPLFGIVNDTENRLMLMLPPEKSIKEASLDETCVPLWTGRALAEEFLEDCEAELTEPHHVEEYGLAELPGLLGQLSQLAEWSEVVAFDLGEDQACPYPIARFVDEIGRVLDRTQRAARAGMLQVLFKSHVINGHKVGSVLLASGQYAAMRMSDGLRAKGSTREEAIERLTCLLSDD